MDCNSLGSSVCGILQARILEWVSISFSKGSSQSTDRTWEATREALKELSEAKLLRVANACQVIGLPR